MTDILIPAAVESRSKEFPRGSQKMDCLMAYVRPNIPNGHHVTDWKRDSRDRLVAVSEPIPDESASDIPPKFRRRKGLK